MRNCEPWFIALLHIGFILSERFATWSESRMYIERSNVLLTLTLILQFLSLHILGTQRAIFVVLLFYAKPKPSYNMLNCLILVIMLQAASLLCTIS